VGGVDAGLVEELPNEFAAFGAVVIQGLVRPLPGDQDTAPSNAQVLGFVGFAFAASQGGAKSFLLVVTRFEGFGAGPGW
jgi:hypothetical protein